MRWLSSRKKLLQLRLCLLTNNTISKMPKPPQSWQVMTTISTLVQTLIRFFHHPMSTLLASWITTSWLRDWRRSNRVKKSQLRWLQACSRLMQKCWLCADPIKTGFLTSWTRRHKISSGSKGNYRCLTTTRCRARMKRRSPVGQITSSRALLCNRYRSSKWTLLVVARLDLGSAKQVQTTKSTSTWASSVTWRSNQRFQQVCSSSRTSQSRCGTLASPSALWA